MIYVFLTISCVVFIELFIFLDLKEEAVQLVTRSREAMSVMKSSTLADDAKELFVRQASIEMFRITFKFAVKLLLLAVVLYAIYWLMITIVPGLRAPILESLVSPIALIGVTIGAVSYSWVRSVILK